MLFKYKKYKKSQINLAQVVDVKSRCDFAGSPDMTSCNFVPTQPIIHECCDC